MQNESEGVLYCVPHTRGDKPSFQEEFERDMACSPPSYNE